MRRVQPPLSLVNGTNVEVWHSRAIQLCTLSTTQIRKLLTPWGFELTSSRLLCSGFEVTTTSPGRAALFSANIRVSVILLFVHDVLNRSVSFRRQFACEKCMTRKLPSLALTQHMGLARNQLCSVQDGYSKQHGVPVRRMATFNPKTHQTTGNNVYFELWFCTQKGELHPGELPSLLNIAVSLCTPSHLFLVREQRAVRYQISDVKCQLSDVRCQMSASEVRMSNSAGLVRFSSRTIVTNQ